MNDPLQKQTKLQAVKAANFKVKQKQKETSTEM